MLARSNPPRTSRNYPRQDSSVFGLGTNYLVQCLPMYYQYVLLILVECCHDFRIGVTSPIHHINFNIIALVGLHQDKLCETLQATAYQPVSKRFIKPPCSISRATPIDWDFCRLPTAGALSNKADLKSVLFNKPKFLKTRTSCRNKENCSTEVHGSEDLELVKLAREPASSRPKPYISLLARSPLLVGSRRKKTDRGQRPAFPVETRRSVPLIFERKGSALPWLVDDRPAHRPRRIWRLLIRYSMPGYACVCCGALPGFPQQCHLLPKHSFAVC